MCILLSAAILLISNDIPSTHHQQIMLWACRIWFSYINPIFWTVYGLIMSQVDNLETLCALETGESQPVYTAVLTIFGYQ